MPPPHPREIGLPQHGTGEMTLAQVGAREHRLHYCLRERSMAWPTSQSMKQSMDTSMARSICQVA